MRALHLSLLMCLPSEHLAAPDGILEPPIRFGLVHGQAISTVLHVAAAWGRAHVDYVDSLLAGRGAALLLTTTCHLAASVWQGCLLCLLLES